MKRVNKIKDSEAEAEGRKESKAWKGRNIDIKDTEEKAIEGVGWYDIQTVDGLEAR